MTHDARHRLMSVRLEHDVLTSRPESVQHEVQTALRDLLQDNLFVPYDEDHGEAFSGPFDLVLRSHDNRLIFSVYAAQNGPLLAEYSLSISPFRSIIRDYFIVCDSYEEAVHTTSASRVEAIDMGRRSIHNEGSELLRELLSEQISLDLNTARRLFTLITVLHARWSGGVK